MKITSVHGVRVCFQFFCWRWDSRGVSRGIFSTCCNRDIITVKHSKHTQMTRTTSATILSTISQKWNKKGKYLRFCFRVQLTELEEGEMLFGHGFRYMGRLSTVLFHPWEWNMINVAPRRVRTQWTFTLFPRYPTWLPDDADKVSLKLPLFLTFGPLTFT